MTHLCLDAGPVPLTHVLAEARSVMRVFATINRLLDALVTLSGAHATPGNDAEWQQLLQRKQVLLDEVETLHPATQVRQARLLAAHLLAAEQWEIAEQLQETVRVMRARFTALMDAEHAAEDVLRQQVDELRELLLAHQRQRFAKTVYQDGAEPRKPRFMNSVR